MRGYNLFNDPKKANCGGCHSAQPTRDGLPPLFTDHQYEALGRAAQFRSFRQYKTAIISTSAFADLYRSDMASQTQYCGMFVTPTLRNTATRQVFFHNGVFRTLQEVLGFYNFRDTDPQKVYPRGSNATVQKYDDIPAQFQANVDVADAPFDRHFGRDAGDDGAGRGRHYCFLADANGRIQTGQVDRQAFDGEIARARAVLV